MEATKEKYTITATYRYKNSNEVFFVDFYSECKDVILAKSSIDGIDLIDSVKNRYFGKKIFYNTFICKDRVVWFAYNTKEQTIEKRVIVFDDEDFLKHLPKEPASFYKKAVEIFLKYAKEKLTQNKTVKLYFDNYKIELSKAKFLVYKDEEIVVENFFSKSEYGEFGNVIINPCTNKSIKFEAPKSINEFLSFYSSIRYKLKTMVEDGVYYKSNVMQLFEIIFLFLVWFCGFFLIWILFMYIDVKTLKDITAFRATIEGIVSLALVETLHAYLKERLK